MYALQITPVLIMGALLLGCGSLSMLVVWLTSPGLRGVGRFSASFACGALAVTMLWVQHFDPGVLILADLLYLGMFILQHMAVLQLASRRAKYWRGGLLLAFQAAVDLLRLTKLAPPHLRVVSLSFLLAVQSLTTAAALWRMSRKEARSPALYNIVLLGTFGSMNVVRSVLIASGRLSAQWQSGLTFLSFCCSVAVALGLAFGFFWMAHASLTAQVEHAASTDPLTRVYNRRVFLKWCEKELLRSQRSGVPFSLLMMDLDHFKKVNDNFGHQRGDDVLCAAVERMQDSVRGIDVLCRWGGEEFAVLLPNAPVEATQIVAERIRENVYRMAVPLTDGVDLLSEGSRLTVSIGAATYRDLDDDITAMLLRADRALYRAKDAGRNRACVGS